MGKQWKQCQTLFLGAPKSLQMVTTAMKLKDSSSLEVSCEGMFLSSLSHHNKDLEPALCELGLSRSAVSLGEGSGIPLLVLGPSLTFLVF